MSFMRDYKEMTDTRVSLIAPPLMKCNMAFKETAHLREVRKETLEANEKALVSVRNLLGECMESSKKRAWKWDSMNNRIYGTYAS